MTPSGSPSLPPAVQKAPVSGKRPWTAGRIVTAALAGVCWLGVGVGVAAIVYSYFVTTPDVGKPEDLSGLAAAIYFFGGIVIDMIALPLALAFTAFYLSITRKLPAVRPPQAVSITPVEMPKS